jgi:MerR family transcriptional regulator/heat shock protein HspR
MAEPIRDIRETFRLLSGGSEPDADWEPMISIGTAAAKVGLSVSALRKYEREGLLLFHRTASARRLLSRSDIRRIQMIRHMINGLGLNMEGIRRLLALLPCWSLKPCTAEEKARCVAVAEPIRPCWMVSDSECARAGADCRECTVYRYGAYCTDTMKALVHSLEDMTPPA